MKLFAGCNNSYKSIDEAYRSKQGKQTLGVNRLK